MSQTEQKLNIEDGCALEDTREFGVVCQNGKRKVELGQGDCQNKIRKTEHNQNGGCQPDLNSDTTNTANTASFFNAENQEVVVSKLFSSDEHSLLDGNSVILKNIEKDVDIVDMCSFNMSSPSNPLQSPSKSRDINEILASFNENIPLSVGLVTSSGNIETATQNSAKSAMSSEDNLQFATRVRSRSSSDPGIALSSEDLAQLEQIAKESNISHDDTELINAGRSIQNDTLDFRIVEPDRNNTLMTPQELERMPDQGLEFEASVGPKDKDSIGDTSEDQSSDSQMASAKNPGIAESSIALGSEQGTTQFIVNTEDGKQQVLNLKMSDVYQVVHLIGNPAVQNISLPPGFAIQDGFLVLPVTTCPGAVDDSNEDQEAQLLQACTVQQISQRDGKIIDMPSTSSGKLYCCMEENCGRLFDKQSKLRIHMMAHTGVRPFKCHIEGCQWAFRTAFQLKRHLCSHEKRKDYMCDVPDCGRMFSTIYNLTAHKKLHNRPLSFNCTVCDEKFDTQRKLDVHHKTHDNAKKEYKCPHPGCERVFFSANCMGSHARWHEQSVDLTCHFEGCGRTFTKLCRLKTHMRMHTGDKPFACKTCGSAFTTNSKLVRHEGIHTNLRPYACPVEGCGKRFPRAEHLTGHMNTHTGEKPFTCTVPGCGAKFSAKSSMHVHIRRHQEGGASTKCKLRFPCPLDGCKKIYSTKASLRGHLMKHCRTNFPGIGSDQTELDIVAMLTASADFASTTADTQGATDTIATVSVSTPLVSTVPSFSHEGSFINPADYLIKEQQPIVTAPSFPSEVITHHIGNNVVTQLVVTDLNQPLPSISSPSLASQNATFSVASDVAGSSSKTLSKEQEEGSARTDFTSNQVWSVKAKNRRQLLKQRLSVGFNFEDRLPDPEAKKKEPVMSGPSLNPHELLTSRAITFRDPETGTTYVQTQLMQDDPPNPEIYTEEDQSSLGSDLTGLQVDHENDSLHDASNVVDFTGTTINLQDLA